MHTLLLSVTIVNSFLSISIVFLNSDCWLCKYSTKNNIIIIIIYSVATINVERFAGDKLLWI